VKTVEFNQALNSGHVTVMGGETDEAFLSNVMARPPHLIRSDAWPTVFPWLHAIFTGQGTVLCRKRSGGWAFKIFMCPGTDGDRRNFPTVVSPNPENPEGFALAVRLADGKHADFILGTDPDADRVGIMIRNAAGTFAPVSGNQTGVLLLDYLIGAKKRAGTMPDNPVALKSIVTTEMARKVAESNGVRCIDTFTGFKFMAERKNEIEFSDEGHVIFSYEESYGYMIGDFVRDKDAVTASLLLTEMAAWYADRNMTLADALGALYETYGYYSEKTMNLVMPGLDGLRRMNELMKHLRASPPTAIAGSKVLIRKDYLSGESVETATGEKDVMALSGSDVLRYELHDHTTIIIRPSGTEPKIKVYILVSGDCAGDCGEKIERYSVWAFKLNK
jgi:phosphoglucomutase